MDDKGYMHELEHNESIQEARNRLGKPSLVEVPEDEVEELKAAPRPKRKNWMRNRPCPCGSGRKFKKCCWHQLKR